MQKMNPDVKVMWVEALRSGEYPQGFLRLRRNDRHLGKDTWCCFGVLTDLYHNETGNGSWKNDTKYGGGFKFVEGTVVDACGPTESVCIWAGIEYGQTNESIVGTLIGMNDERSNDFDTIANWIEVYL